MLVIKMKKITTCFQIKAFAFIISFSPLLTSYYLLSASIYNFYDHRIYINKLRFIEFANDNDIMSTRSITDYLVKLNAVTAK